VRCGHNEYVDTAVRPEEKAPVVQPDIFDEVLGTIRWFLMGPTAIACKQEEVERILARFHATIIKTLKQHKMDTARQIPPPLPCLPSVLANTIDAMHLRTCARATPQLCHFCANHIAKCINVLGMGHVHAKRVSLVVGLLYLMKQGLIIQNVQWLPRVPSLERCLPHETCLEKTFKLSMKLVCETENEIKLALRQRVNML
jgi:hypothetical protein